MMPAPTQTMTRRQYEDRRWLRQRRRKEVRDALRQAHAPDQDRLQQELDRLPELPALPAAYVYMLYEPDGNYIGTVRTREEVRQLRADGVECTARRAKDLNSSVRPVDEKYRKLTEVV